MEHDSESYVASRLADPEFAAAYDDAEALLDALKTLALRRRDLDLSQRDVARRMKTTQSAISDLETAQTDPRVSTLQRYARAVDAKLTLNVVSQSAYSWSHTFTASGAFTPTGMAWATVADNLFGSDYFWLPGSYSLLSNFGFGLGTLALEHGAVPAKSADREDGQAEPPDLVLAA